MRNLDELHKSVSSRTIALSLILCYSFNSDGRLKTGIVADYLEVAMAKIVLA